MSSEVSIDKKVLAEMSSWSKEEIEAVATEIEEGTYKKRKPVPPSPTETGGSTASRPAGLRESDAAISSLTDRFYYEMRKISAYSWKVKLRAALKFYGGLRIVSRAIEWLFSHEPVSEQDITSIESLLNIKFPGDYVECAKNNHGGNPIPKIYDFGGHQEAVFSSLLSLNPKENNYILDVYDNVKDRLLSGIYPFADDPFENLICFDYRNSDGQSTVVIWDHEICYEDLEKAIIPVCKTFS